LATVVLKGGVGSVGEGFDSLADSLFPEINLALFARGNSSSSSELIENRNIHYMNSRKLVTQGKSGDLQVQVIFGSEEACRTFRD
jgi:hypothetical protein